MTIHVSAAIEEHLHQLAESEQSTVDQVAERVLSYFFRDQDDLVRAVAEGREAVRQGDLIDHEQAMVMMDDVIANG